jgi:hypothetical protein
MMQFNTPVPVVVKQTKEEGYAIYVTNSGPFDNDVWAVVLKDGGHIRHYTSDQLLMSANATMKITKQKDLESNRYDRL